MWTEALIELRAEVGDEDVFCSLSCLVSHTSDLSLWHRVQDVAASFAVVGSKCATLALTAGLQACIALLKDDSDLRARLGELGVRYGARVMYDLAACQSAALKSGSFSTYQLMCQDALSLLDLQTQVIEVLPNMIRPLIRCFI